MKSARDCSEDELRFFAQDWAKSSLHAGDVVQLEGPMGAGKSTFARFVVEALGGPALSEGSPTFAILHDYRGAAGLSLRHADLYRLKSEPEIEDAGLTASVWEDGAQALHLIEWVSLFPGFEAELQRLPRVGRRLWKVTLTVPGQSRHERGGRDILCELFGPR